MAVDVRCNHDRKYTLRAGVEIGNLIGKLRRTEKHYGRTCGIEKQRSTGGSTPEPAPGPQELRGRASLLMSSESSQNGALLSEERALPSTSEVGKSFCENSLAGACEETLGGWQQECLGKQSL